MYNINTKLIKSKIYKKGYTINQIANKLSINNQTLSNQINNRNITNITKFLELLHILDIEINDIIENKK